MKRRTFLIGAGAVVSVPSFVDVTVAQTTSGNVELNADVTLPTDTTVLVEIFEDIDTDGTENDAQERSLSDGVNTYEYDQLTGTTNGGIEYWMDVQLSTSDTSVTPEVNSLEIVLPEETTPTPTEEPGDDPQAFSDDIVLPMQVSFRDMNVGNSIFLIGLLATMLGGSVLTRNMLAFVAGCIAFVLLIVAGVFGLGLEMFWMAVIATIILLTAGMILRWSA